MTLRFGSFQRQKSCSKTCPTDCKPDHSRHQELYLARHLLAQPLTHLKRETKGVEASLGNKVHSLEHFSVVIVDSGLVDVLDVGNLFIKSVDNTKSGVR